MERQIHSKSIRIISIFALLTVVALIVTYRYYINVSHESGIVGSKAMERVDCWRQDESTGLIICLRDVPACGQGWNTGTPRPPLRCSF